MTNQIGHNSKAAITAELEEVKPVKTRKCLQIICEVPMESADAALEALGGFPIPGQSRPVAIALLKPESATEAAAERPPPKIGPICMRAVLLCKRADFQEWLYNPPPRWVWDGKVAGSTRDQVTDDLVRRLCGVESRKELDHDADAAAIFMEMEQDFYASQRGQTTEAYETMARDGR